MYDQTKFDKLNSAKGILISTIPPLASPSKAFHVGDNYNKKNAITHADMLHSESTNSLKMQQELLIEGWKIPGMTYLQTGGRRKSNLNKKGGILKKKFETLIQNQYHPLGYMYERDTEQKK